MAESGIVGVGGTHYGHPDCPTTKWNAEGGPSLGSAMVHCTCPPRADTNQLVDLLSAEQKRIDANREAMADEIIAWQRITTVEEGKRFARAWIITTARHATNEAYYRGERDKLLRVIETANNQLFDSTVDDVEHQIACHTDTLPEAFRRVAAGHSAAFDTLQTIVHEWVEPSSPIDLCGAFSEDLTNEDGSLVTVEQARERNAPTFTVTGAGGSPGTPDGPGADGFVRITED